MSIAQSIYVALLVIGVLIMLGSFIYSKTSKSEYAMFIRDMQLYAAANLYLKYGRTIHAFLGTSTVMIGVYIPLLLGWNVAAIFTLIASTLMFVYQIYLVGKVSKDRRLLASVQDMSLFV